MSGNLPLIFAQQTQQTFLELARLQTFSDWWQWMLLAAVCVVLAVVVIALYIVDCRELPLPVAIVLTALRLVAFGGLLFYFLQLEQRSEREVVKNSRVLMLVDTSLSMGLTDTEYDDAGQEVTSRIDRVVTALEDDHFLDELRSKHDVICYRFDEQAQPTEVASFPRIESNDDATGPVYYQDVLQRQLQRKRGTLIIAGVLFLLGVLGLAVYAATSRRRKSPRWRSWLLVEGVTSMAGAAWVSSLDTAATGTSLRITWKVLPLPSSLVTWISPPINPTSRLLMASPRPVPPYSLMR